ncbi:MAG TPA: hypothetical protein VKK31_02530 [Thermoanaerobaculia bacterium]|nr:hypothetical protein [Thermoanaerobaculia bacterium]
MFAAALIPYNPEEQDFTLEELLDHLSASLAVECTMTEWQGFDEKVPQVRVATGVPLTIQIEDDPEYVPEDIASLVEGAEGALPEAWRETLRGCTARLDVLEAEIPFPVPDENGVVPLAAAFRLDPSMPDVEAVIVEIARFLDSVAYDNVNDEWLVPEG